MKKYVLGLVLIFALSGCSSGSSSNSDANSSNESSSISSSSAIESTVESSATPVNDQNLEDVAKIMEDKFNTDGEKLVKVEIEKDVIDDTSDDAHSVIKVTVIDDEARKNMQTMKDAVDSNTADDTQRTSIYGIQLNVEEAAQQLENENDIVQFINPDTNGNNIVIAMSKKNENIIPLIQ